MYKAVLAAALLAALGACAHQPSDDSKKAPDTDNHAHDVLENNDGYCDEREARQAQLHPDCRNQAQQRQSRPSLNRDKRLNDAQIRDLSKEVDRNLPNLGSNRLGL